MRKKLFIISAILLSISAMIVLFLINNKYKNNQDKLKHFFTKDVEVITDLSIEEQKYLLELFNVQIPDTEPNAYIYSFQKYHYGSNIHAYIIEFDNVISYRNFYEANNSRIGKNGLPDLSFNQIAGMSSEQLLNGEFEEIYEGKNDYYLTYQVLLHKTGSQQIPDTFKKYSDARKNDS
ncbi:MAG: hypothetical protein IJZ65_04475 [Ruminiclostridium sp.]|nr:hypothetical protein [Ruminiclostridium sp.]MBQ8841869.1 hypothetical protein [Ruminiclostridium sp.]